MSCEATFPSLSDEKTNTEIHETHSQETLEDFPREAAAIHAPDFQENEVTSTAPAAPVTPPPSRQKKKKWKPRGGSRILLAIAAYALVVLLTVTLTATVLVADIRLITSGDNLRAVFSSFLSSERFSASALPTPGAAGISGEINTEGLGKSASAEEIAEEIFNAVTEQYQGELKVDKDQFFELYEQSTLPQLLADKLASCAEDVLNGTSNARITEEEILTFMDENAALIQEVFGVEINDQTKQTVLNFAEEVQLDTLLQDFVTSQIANLPLGDGGMTVQSALSQVRKCTSAATLWLLIGIDLLLAVLIFLASWLRLGTSLRRVSAPFLIVGGLLSIPLLIIKSIATGATERQIADIFIRPVEPLHYGILIAGVVLLIGGIILSIAKKEDK